MRQLNAVHPPLVILFARLAAIGRAARSARRTAASDDLGGQTPVAAGGDQHNAGGQVYDTVNRPAAQIGEVRG